MATRPEPALSLTRYDAMCTAIAECHGIDEVKDIRDRAVALQEYAKQAQNLENERRAAEIRIRAERRAGELLAEMKQAGLLSVGGRPPKTTSETEGVSGKVTIIPKCATTRTTLKEAGITEKQSSEWQQLAAIPEEEFVAALASPDRPVPSTSAIIAAARGNVIF